MAQRKRPRTVEAKETADDDTELSASSEAAVAEAAGFEVEVELTEMATEAALMGAAEEEEDTEDDAELAAGLQAQLGPILDSEDDAELRADNSNVSDIESEAAPSTPPYSATSPSFEFFLPQNLVASAGGQAAPPATQVQPMLVPPSPSAPLSNMEQPYVVGISGSSRAGKTTLAEGLLRRLCGEVSREPRRGRTDRVARYVGISGARVSIISQDSFIRPDVIGTCGASWEHPEAVDHDRVFEALQAEARDIHVHCVVFEGYKAFHDQRVQSFLHICLWLETPCEVVRARRLRSKRCTEEYFDKEIWPSHERYVHHVLDLERRGLCSVSRLDGRADKDSLLGQAWQLVLQGVGPRLARGASASACSLVEGAASHMAAECFHGTPDRKRQRIQGSNNCLRTRLDGLLAAVGLTDNPGALLADAKRLSSAVGLEFTSIAEVVAGAEAVLYGHHEATNMQVTLADVALA